MHTQGYNMHPFDGSMFMTILTIGFYSIAVFGKIGGYIFGGITLQGAAGLMAILAAASTLILNAYRFYNDYKNNQNNKKHNNHE